MSKILYLEEKPIKRSLTFENRQDYLKFFDTYCQSVINYCWDNNIYYKDYWNYKRVLLNKDGRPRKEVFPYWLNTKKSRDKQKVNFLKYKKERAKQQKVLSIQRLEKKIDEIKKQIESLK